MSRLNRFNLSSKLVGFIDRSRSRYAELTRLVTFGFVGLSGMLIDLGVLYVVHPLTGLAIGRAVAIATAMTWNFFGNRAVTFQDKATGSVWQLYWKFVASCSFGAAVNWTTSIALAANIELFRENVILSAIGGVLAGFLLNFELCRRWVFNNSHHNQSTARTTNPERTNANQLHGR